MLHRVSIVVICVVAFPLDSGCRQVNRTPAPAVSTPAPETVEEFWPDGSLRLRKEVLRWPDGTVVDHGAYTCWYENGRLMYQAVYKNGKLDGVETEWHRNGQKWTEARYQNGLRHGPRYSWDEAGRKRKEEHYFEDKPDGTWTIWGQDGAVKWQGRFDKGRPFP